MTSPFLDILQTLNIRALYRRVEHLEERMATNDNLIARVRAATDNLAAKVRRLSEGDARWEPIISELEAMGADERNPIPESNPESDQSER